MISQPELQGYASDYSEGLGMQGVEIEDIPRAKIRPTEIAGGKIAMRVLHKIANQ